MAHERQSSVGLLVDGVRRNLREEEVRRISQRRQDSLANGALWGFAVGGALAAFGAASADLPAGLIPIVIAFYGGIGSGTGVAIDALVKSPHVVYLGPARSARRLVVSPIVAGETRGVSLSFSF